MKQAVVNITQSADTVVDVNDADRPSEIAVATSVALSGMMADNGAHTVVSIDADMPADYGTVAGTMGRGRPLAF